MSAIPPTTHPQWLLVVMILLGILPFLVMCCTCYLKVSIVINLLKGGLGFSSGGTMAIEFALSAALVALVMHPIASESVNNLAKIPPLRFDQAPRWSDLTTLEPAIAPWRSFLQKQTGDRELSAVSELAERSAVDAKKNSAESLTSEERSSTDLEKKGTPLRVLFAAFVLSELRGALLIGIMVLIPFLLVDLLIANTLTALGLTMVSPITIALPCKLLLFWGCDGWILISRTVLSSY